MGVGVMKVGVMGVGVMRMHREFCLRKPKTVFLKLIKRGQNLSKTRRGTQYFDRSVIFSSSGYPLRAFCLKEHNFYL